jgi:hypothetical protein
LHLCRRRRGRWRRWSSRARLLKQRLSFLEELLGFLERTGVRGPGLILRDLLLDLVFAKWVGLRATFGVGLNRNGLTAAYACARLSRFRLRCGAGNIFPTSPALLNDMRELMRNQPLPVGPRRRVETLAKDNVAPGCERPRYSAQRRSRSRFTAMNAYIAEVLIELRFHVRTRRRIEGSARISPEQIGNCAISGRALQSEYGLTRAAGLDGRALFGRRLRLERLTLVEALPGGSAHAATPCAAASGGVSSAAVRVLPIF